MEYALPIIGIVPDPPASGRKCYESRGKPIAHSIYNINNYAAERFTYQVCQLKLKIQNYAAGNAQCPAISVSPPTGLRPLPETQIPLPVRGIKRGMSYVQSSSD